MPYQWLGAGAITVGIGAALAGGTAVADADDGAGGSSADRASAASSAGPKATAKPTRPGSPKTGVSARVQSSRAPNALGSVKSKRSVAVASEPSGNQAPSAPGAEVLAAALAATTRRESATSSARSAAVVNSQAEIAREKAVADINMSVGWVPGVGTVVNGLSLVSDFADFALAALKGDAADMRDEIQDMAIDVVGMVPAVGAPLAATIHRARMPINRAPRPTDDSYSVDQDAQLTGNVLTNDTDPEGDPLSAAVDSGPSHGNLTLNSNGSFTYTPAENYYGTDSFSYTVSDGNGGTAISTASITVKYVAPPPVVDQDHPYTIDTTDPATGTISGHFNVTHDKPFTYHLATAPDSTLGAFQLNEQTGEWTFTPNPRTRVIAGFFELTSPAAVNLSFSVTATDGAATTAPIAVSEHLAGADRAAFALPSGTIPILSYVDPRTGDAYVFGYRGNVFGGPGNDSVSYLAAVIHSDGSSSIPAGGDPASGAVRKVFVVGDTTFVVSESGYDESTFQTHLSTLGPAGLAPLGDPIPGYFKQPLTVAGTTYLVTQSGTYESDYQTHLSTLGPDGVTSTTAIPGSFYDRTFAVGNITYLVTDTGTYESGYHTHLTTMGSAGVTSTTEVPGRFYDRTLVIGDTTYLVTNTGTYESGYQTHLIALGPEGEPSTTSIPGQFYEDSSGYSVVVGDITFLVTQTGNYDSGYTTHVTEIGPGGVSPTATILGWSWDEPTVIGDTTYLLVATQSANVTQVVALTSGGATSIGSIPGVVSGDPIVVGGTTYVISHIGDSGTAATWQTVVTTLAPTPGGITVIGAPIPGYRWGVSPLVVGDTTYLITETWNSSVGYETHLTALLPDGVATPGTAILGTVSGNPTVVVAGDTTYLITTVKYYWTSDWSYAYTRTLLTAVEPEGLTQWQDPLHGYPGIAPITIGDNTYLVMETDDPATGYQLQLVSVTTDGVIPIGAPASGRVNSHSDFDLIIVGDTTYLMVETPNTAGGHQTSLVKVGADGLTTLSGTLPGHPVSNAIVVGDTTYVVTQTGQLDTAQTHFTALDPLGVLQPTYTAPGELAQQLIVAGGLTYVRTHEWVNDGDGSYSTNHVRVTALTPAGPSSVDYPVQYGEPPIVVGDTTYLVSTVFPDTSGIGTDTTKTYIVALTPHGAVQLAEPVRGYSAHPIVLGDTTYLVFASYPDDVDDFDDFTTYLVMLTADGPVLANPFPGLAPIYMDPIVTLGDTTYVTTTSGVWAISVDTNSAGRL